MGTVKRMEARGRTHLGGLKQGGTNSTPRAGGRRRSVVSLPWCHPSVTQVPAMGPRSGYSPWDAFWDGGPRAFGMLVLPQGLGRSDAEPRPWGAPFAPQNKARVGVQGTERRAGGHSTGGTTTGEPRAARTPRTRSRPPHASPGTITPARGPAPHLHAPTPSTGTELYRAVPSRTVPYRTSPGRTESYRTLPSRTGPVPRPRARPFIHPPAPWERAARAAGGKRSPAVAPPLPARMNERTPPSSILGHPALLCGRGLAEPPRPFAPPIRSARRAPRRAPAFVCGGLWGQWERGTGGVGPMGARDGGRWANGSAGWGALGQWARGGGAGRSAGHGPARPRARGAASAGTGDSEGTGGTQAPPGCVPSGCPVPSSAKDACLSMAVCAGSRATSGSAPSAPVDPGDHGGAAPAPAAHLGRCPGCVVGRDRP